MKSKFYFAILIFFVALGNQKVNGQDTIYTKAQDSVILTASDRTYKLNYKNLIAPAVFIGYGIASFESDGLKKLHYSTRHEIWEHQPSHIRLDNYTQYAPALIVYGLNAAGIKGKHNFRDRTIIYAASQLISAAFVVPLKHIVKEERPDSPNKHSFPSGHTATAFSSAQFMFREYKGTNFWISISGYPFAIFTGIYRTLNDRHWVHDVVAGAGFGILSTELAYWLYPKINGLFKSTNQNTPMMFMPFYQDKAVGIGLVRSF